MRSAGNIILPILIILSAPACLEDPDLKASPSSTAVDGPPVTRSQVILTADSYARAHWTMTPENRYGVTCNNTFTSYYQIGDRIGVGYKWGGWTELDEFLEKVSQGYATGTGGGVTWETIPFECVVGVSCTGLVSRAWHLNNKYTLNYDDPDIPRKFQEITHVIEGVDLASRNVSALKKGDVFINKYHVMIFVYETKQGVPVIIDSSGPGVRFRNVTWTSLAADRYTAIRYNNIVDDRDPAGTITNPVKLMPENMRLSVDGNTRDVVSLEFHSYAIAPSIRQTGPEVIYEFHLQNAGTLEAAITQFRAEGIDNDIHLLSSLEKNEMGMALDCVARGDIKLEAELARGTYYIIVDGRYNSPGEYTLTVSFRPESLPGQ